VEEDRILIFVYRKTDEVFVEEEQVRLNFGKGVIVSGEVYVVLRGISRSDESGPYRN